MEPDHWITKSGAGQRGSVMMILHPRLGRRTRRWVVGEDFALCELGMCPPPKLCSCHAPSVSSGQEAFEQSLARLQEEMDQIARMSCPGHPLGGLWRL